MRVAPGQQYGQRIAQERAQQAVPLAGATSPGPAAAPSPSAPPPSGGMPTLLSGPPPGLLTPLDAPTQRPDEPITAGMDVGPGPGRAALGQLGGIGEDVNAALRAIFSRYPNEDIRRVLEAVDTDDGSGVS